jgi:hypothetical protein
VSEEKFFGGWSDWKRPGREVGTKGERASLWGGSFEGDRFRGDQAASSWRWPREMESVGRDDLDGDEAPFAAPGTKVNRSSDQLFVSGFPVDLLLLPMDVVTFTGRDGV